MAAYSSFGMDSLASDDYSDSTLSPSEVGATHAEQMVENQLGHQDSPPNNVGSRFEPHGITRWLLR